MKKGACACLGFCFWVNSSTHFEYIKRTHLRRSLFFLPKPYTRIERERERETTQETRPSFFFVERRPAFLRVCVVVREERSTKD